MGWNNLYKWSYNLENHEIRAIFWVQHFAGRFPFPQLWSFSCTCATSAKRSTITLAFRNQTEWNLSFGRSHLMDGWFWMGLPSLKLTAKTPKNWCLEDDRFLLGWRNVAGTVLVLGRVKTVKFNIDTKTMFFWMYLLSNMTILGIYVKFQRGM